MPTRLAAVLLVLGASGCATIIRGGQQHVAATTRPSGATVRAGDASCTTPCALVLPRKRSHSLEIEKPGYEKEQVPIYSGVDGLVVANLFLLPLAIPGALVDFLSGAAWELVPSDFNVNLRPMERAPGDGPESPFAPIPDDAPAVPRGRPEDPDGWKAIPGDGATPGNGPESPFAPIPDEAPAPPEDEAPRVPRDRPEGPDGWKTIPDGGTPL